MIVGSAEQGTIHDDPPDVEVQVVVPGDPDTTVELHAILQDRGRFVPDVRLGHADEFVRLLGPAVHRSCRCGRGPQTGLRPHFHVGKPVLEGLVRREGPPERVPVEGVREREGEDVLRDPCHGGALEGHGQLEEPLHLYGRSSDFTQNRVGRQHHVVERHGGEAPDEVDTLGCDDAHSGSIRVDQELRELTIDKGGDHEEPRFTCGLGRRLRAR